MKKQWMCMEYNEEKNSLDSIQNADHSNDNRRQQEKETHLGKSIFTGIFRRALFNVVFSDE